MSFIDEREDDDEDELAPVTEEQRARAMGWRPLPEDPDNPQPHEYRGDPRRWTDAATFIAHGEEELPILRDQNRRMSERLVRNEGEITTLKKTVDEQDRAVKAAIALARRADLAGYNRAKAELVTQRREAVEAGDTVAFDQVQEQIDAMEAERALQEEPEEAPAPAREEPPPAAPPATDPAIDAFIRANPWFNDRQRPQLRTAMIGMHNAVIAEHPNMATAEQLETALERMEAAYPEIAPEGDDMRQPSPPPRRRAPSALPPSAPPERPRRPGASPIDGIADQTERAEARSAFNSIKRQDPAFTEAEYMSMYDDPHADVLELRKQRKP